MTYINIIKWRLRPEIVYAHALNAYLHRITLLRYDRSFATPPLICFLFDHSTNIVYFSATAYSPKTK
jgi:hypothetical protein